MKSPKAPAPPPVQDPIDVIDNINKTVTKTVVGADGKKQTVIERLPLTPEEQAWEDKLKQITETNLSRIEQLSQVAMAADIPEFADTVNRLRSEQTRIRDTSFSEAARQQERALARSGLQDSTAAVKARRLAEQAQTEAVATDEANLNLLAEDLRNAAIDRSKELLGTSAALTADQVSRLNQAAQFGAGLRQTDFVNRNNVALNQYNAQLAAYQARRPSFGSQLLGAGATLGAAYLTGGGSLFGGFGGAAGGATLGNTGGSWLNPNTNMLIKY